MEEPKLVGLCALCEIPMCSAKVTPPRGAWYDKHKGRRLCSSCYGVRRRNGTLESFPRSTRAWVQTFRDFQAMQSSGMTRREIAEVLGITIAALDKAKKKARNTTLTKGKRVDEPGKPGYSEVVHIPGNRSGSSATGKRGDNHAV